MKGYKLQYAFIMLLVGFLGYFIGYVQGASKTIVQESMESARLSYITLEHLNDKKSYELFKVHEDNLHSNIVLIERIRNKNNIVYTYPRLFFRSNIKSFNDEQIETNLTAYSRLIHSDSNLITNGKNIIENTESTLDVNKKEIKNKEYRYKVNKNLHEKKITEKDDPQMEAIERMEKMLKSVK